MLSSIVVALFQKELERSLPVYVHLLTVLFRPLLFDLY